jgi:hypothetical protein
MRLGVRGHVRAFKAATLRRTPKRPRRNCLLFDHEEHEAWRSADFRRFRFMNQEKRKSGNGAVGSCVPAFLIKLSVSHLC